MATLDPLPPLEIAKRLQVPLAEVSLRLGVTTDWLRHLARNPKHARRVRVAELEAALEQQRLELSLESLLRSRP